MAKLDVTYAYAADIVKSERDPETGDLMVYGKATGPDLDLDGQICDPEWLKTAMPAWMEWGNIREQHGMVAAGVGTQLDQIGDDWYVTARIVDEGAARKVEAGVYKGYSIGIKNPRVVKDLKAPGGRIVGGEIVENSLVDRPCNPTAKMTICKSVGLAEDGDSIEVQDGAEAADVPLLPVEVGDVDPVTGDEVVAVIDAPGLDGQPESADVKTVGVDLLRQLRAAVREVADLVKAAKAIAPVEPVEPVVEEMTLATEPDMVKGESVETQDLVKAAVTEAMKAHEAEMASLRAELAKVNARPIPGGPVLARPRAVIAAAGEREQTLAEVEKFATLARTYRQIDPAFAASCDEKVKGLRSAAKD